jgi:hypothetical protein
MNTLIYESWVIDYDDELTREIFKDVISGPLSCKCGNCKNFTQAREQVYPENFKKVLNQLGIDYQKETEVFQITRIKAGWHLYGGWFHFAGQIKKASENEELSMCGRDSEKPDFVWSFNNKQDLIPKAFGQNPVVQINWNGKVPWVIDMEESK